MKSYQDDYMRGTDNTMMFGYGEKLEDKLFDMITHAETAEELEIVRLISQGKDNVEIGKITGNTEFFVERIREHLKRDVYDDEYAGVCLRADCAYRTSNNVAIYIWQKRADMAMLLFILRKIQEHLEDYDTLTIRRVYVDVGECRSDYRRMMDDCRNDHIDVVAVYSLTDLAESMKDILLLLTGDFLDMGLHCISVEEEYNSMEEKLQFVDA